MSIEEIVRASMEQLARDLQPTVPSPAAVRARVNRGRRVKSIAATGLAAAVAAGVLLSVSELRDRSGGSEPTHSVNIGVDADAVWMVDGVLHIGGQAYPQDKPIVTALVPIASGAVYGAPGGEIVYQPADGPAQIVQTYGDANPSAGPTPVGPAADPDSDSVAILRWSADDGRYDLYVGDAARGNRIDLAQPLGDEDWTLPGDPNPFGDHLLAPIYWFGLNPDGSYTTLIRNGQELWRSDLKPNGAGSLAPLGKAPLDATPDVLANVDADGLLTFTTPSGKTLASVDDVEPDGGLSHDGTYFASLSSDPEHSGEIAIVNTRTGETRYIGPPSGTVATLPTWSHGHTLMFRATDVATKPSGLVVACDADAFGCENVAAVDDISQAVLPRL
jgi:hypothetical protein